MSVQKKYVRYVTARSDLISCVVAAAAREVLVMSFRRLIIIRKQKQAQTSGTQPQRVRAVTECRRPNLQKYLP
jgi:hypothetical protein